MLLIGLTGPSGAGKSAVARLFADYGLPILDADEIYHALLVPPSPCLGELTLRFGTDILNADGTLNRPALGRIVFSDPAALSDLNTISHRYVMEDVRARVEHLRRRGTRAAVLDAPQLFEAGANRICSTIVAVLADRSLRLERIMMRDGLDTDSALRRINAQKSDDYFRAHADYIIENSGNAEHLAPAVHRILCETGVIPT
ncbi:MAG: dephospho-CoA kinase [Clostridia bacterium]|nr:dephospho-CoA kinase [Clostridia bacterium]